MYWKGGENLKKKLKKNIFLNYFKVFKSFVKEEF